MQTLADVMRREFLTVAPEDTLGEAAEKMVGLGVGSVFVQDFGRLIGILTERDMLKAMAGRVHTSEARVREWMTADPVTATPDTPVDDAVQTMLERRFRHLPVMDGEQIAGIVSLRDLTRTLATGETV